MCRNWGGWLNLLTGITYPLPHNNGYFLKTRNIPIILTEGPSSQIQAFHAEARGTRKWVLCLFNQPNITLPADAQHRPLFLPALIPPVHREQGC